MSDYLNNRFKYFCTNFYYISVISNIRYRTVPATSLAGHDKGLTYVITGVDNEYVYVTDGRLRQVDEPKKKKLKHIQLIKICDDTIKDKISRNIKLTNEDIKLAIKKYNNR